MKIALATSNQGKIREFKAAIQELPVDFIPQAHWNIPPIAEEGLSFIENAILKARHAARFTKIPTIADDSGLIVPILNGHPGIYSARYAGEKASEQDNIAKLLTELKNVPENQRNASFYCVIVYLSHPLDPKPIVAEGTLNGSILHEPHGQEGFGYDPVFYISSVKKTAAEIPLSLKNKISHRAIALQTLIKQLKNL